MDQSHLANAALFQSTILAYNTLRWMALMSNNKQLRQWEPETIRTFLIQVAGKRLTGGNQLTVKLAQRTSLSAIVGGLADARLTTRLNPTSLSTPGKGEGDGIV